MTKKDLAAIIVCGVVLLSLVGCSKSTSINMQSEVKEEKASEIFPDEFFQFYNKLPIGMSLSYAKKFLDIEGFEITEEPNKEGNGWLLCSKWIGPSGMRHHIHAKFESGYLISVVESFIDP